MVNTYVLAFQSNKLCISIYYLLSKDFKNDKFQNKVCRLHLVFAYVKTKLIVIIDITKS